MERVVNETQAMSLLYIDDTLTASSEFPGLLHQTGLNLSLTHSTGAEAVALCGNQAFDILVINHRTPQLDGLLLAKELRKNPGHQFSPMLMLSSQGNEHCR